MASAESESLLRSTYGSYDGNQGTSPDYEPQPYAVNHTIYEAQRRTQNGSGNLYGNQDGNQSGNQGGNQSGNRRRSEEIRGKGCCGSIGWRRGCYIACIASTSFVFLASVVIMILSFVVTTRTEPEYNFPADDVSTVPSAPRAPTASLLGIESITISWTEPDLHSSILQGYEVQYSENAVNFTTHLPGPGINRIYEAEGLDPNTAYWFRVRAINTIGPGNFSAPSQAFVTLNATAPGAPTKPRVTATTTTSLSLSWSLGKRNGAEVLGTQIQVAVLVNDTDPEWEDLFFDSLVEATVDSLLVGTTYLVRVRTLSVQGESSWGSNATYHTDTQFATTPTFPFPLILDSLACSSIKARWSRPADHGSEILRYVVTFTDQKTNQTYEFTSLRNIDGENEEVTGTGLQWATRHLTTVTTQSSRGESLPAIALLYTTRFPSAPEMPLSPFVTDATSTSITVQWVVPEINCDPITRYTLEMDDWWYDKTFLPVYQGAELTATIIDLIPAVTYSFRLTAENNYGQSAVSYISSFTTFNRGSCGNINDVAAVKANSEIMQEVIQSCLIRCAIGGTECGLECIMNDLGLSEACSYCWVSMGQCTLEVCSIECLHPTSEACARCTEERCYEDTIRCTGMPPSTFPNP